MSQDNKCIDKVITKGEFLLRMFGAGNDEYRIFYKRKIDADEDDVKWMLSLLKRNMKSMYSESEWGWKDAEKLKELTHKSAKYLVVRNVAGINVAFVHFRIDREDGYKCVYCYEIQLESFVQRHGIGQHLMYLIEVIALNLNIYKLFCTVFKSNEASVCFFRKLNFIVSSHSPACADYVILRKDVHKHQRKNCDQSSSKRVTTSRRCVESTSGSVTMSGIDGVKHIIAVLSGKGGVGKSSVTALLAVALHKKGFKVGVLDVDLCGPSIPHVFHVAHNTVLQSEHGWEPVHINADKTLSVMSIGFLTENKDDAIIWRGPKKNAIIKQFVSDVHWGDIDYLLIDTPPGTSDEHISVMENILKYKPDGAILVTTPQAVSVGDVRREVTFCKKTKLPVIGIIENMSGYVCPHCQECTNIFSKGGGKQLADYSAVPFLGELPVDSKYNDYLDNSEQVITDLQCDLLEKTTDIVNAFLCNVGD